MSKRVDEGGMSERTRTKAAAAKPVAAKITTERLVLTPFSPADAVELLALFHEKHVRRYLLDDRIVDRAWIDREVAASNDRFRSENVGLYSTRLRGKRPIIGFAGFRAFGAPPHAELLYGLDERELGKGIASEMTRAVIDCAFRDEVDFVEATVDAPNVASVRLLERLGMRRVTQAPDATRLSFELTYETWARTR